MQSCFGEVPMLTRDCILRAGASVRVIYRSKFSEDVFVPYEVHDAFSSLFVIGDLKLKHAATRKQWGIALLFCFSGKLELL